ncbi:thymidylate synthase [Psychrobacillus sp. FSL H8-0484]|uniref:thymidylate synthase n=1 Tax=Psychrobacillus sp. FSL H8-0484 TaxID=2921390 RepID=UPI0030F5201E
MQIVFVLTEDGQELFQLVSNDVAGVLAAAQGESVTFPSGHFKYDFHNLDHYIEDDVYKQELVIYLKRA